MPAPSPQRRVSPAGVLLGSFAGAILLGAALLRLPVMQTKGDVSFLDCLFTSTSAICVTGLASVDTGVAWTTAGLATITTLVQAGGLGIMTFSVAMIYLAGRRPSVRSHLAVRGALGPVPGHEIGRLARDVLLYTVTLEALGALILFWRFWQDMPAGQALGVAVFHAISAFCNAGFSTFSANLEDYTADPTVNLVVMALIVLGGIGFVVLREVRVWLLWPRRAERRRPRLSLHTKVVLLTSVALIVGGALVLWLLEHNASGGQAWRGSVWPVLFCSVTPRTAGFNTVPMAELSNSSLLFIILLMFVGASPGSTGGGVKTTTFAVLMALLSGRLRGQDQVVMGKRGISQAQVGEAQTLVLATGLVLTMAVLLLVSLDYDMQGRERGDLLAYTFEAVSAFGTVGLSMGITYDLAPAAKIVLILLMFLGRVGPLTFIYLVSTRFAPARYRLAEERLMLG